MKNLNKIHRRNFLKAIGVLSLAPFINACDSSVGFWGDEDGTSRDRPTKPNVDILIDGTEEEIAQSLQNKDSLIQDLYQNPGKELKIGFLQGHTYNTLKLSFVKSNLASYQHLRIVNTYNNETANILWGRDGLYPTIRFVDNYGNVIIKNGKPLEFQISLPSKLNKTASPADWIIAGIKIFGIALLLWIGFSIAKYVVSAIAFIAFNAMAIGLVLAGLGIVIEIIQWILGRTGITINDVAAFFRKTVSSLVALLLEVTNYIVNYSG
ncbi:MAG: hypothetical protein WHV63_00355 [Ignavibacteria bacterium]